METAQFDAFVRRILRAYARRVAAGDIEALRSLSQLSSEVDIVCRAAVADLRKPPWGYSWSEIADRLGVTKQTAHERYGERAGRGVLDSRLRQAGMTISVATLVAVFTDHHPGSPAASVCPGCGYRYPDGSTSCPSLATVRPLLLRRRGEDRDAVAQLSGDLLADLHKPLTARTRAGTVRQAAASVAPGPDRPATPLFSLSGKDLA